MTNTGNTTFEKVTIEDKLMTGSGTLKYGEDEKTVPLDSGYVFENLDPQDSFTLSYTYQAGASGTLRNNVTVTGENGTTDRTFVDVTVNNPEIQITKTVSGMTGANNTAAEGDTPTYKVTVSNTGDTKVDAVVSDDMWTSGKVSEIKVDNDPTASLDNNKTYTVSGLDEDESCTITYTYTVTAEDVENGGIDNAATADIDSDGYPDAKVEITTETGKPSLTVEKTADVTSVQVGNEITYTIEVKNNGYTTLSNVVVQDSLWTADTELTARGDVTGEYDATEGKYYIETLEPGDTLTITYTVTPTTAGPLTNEVTVTSDDLPDGDEPSDQVTVDVTEPETGEPSLTVEKTADVTSFQVGNEITYTIEVKNSGYTTLSNVVVQDSLWTADTELTARGDVTGEYDATEGKYYIETLEPGDTLTITYTVTPTTAGPLTNEVTVTSDDLPDGDEPSDQVTVDVTEPETVPDPDSDIVVTKTPDQDTAQVGDTITWAITVTNNGSVVYDGLSLKDVLNGEALDIDSGEYTNVSDERQSGAEEETPEEPSTEEPSTDEPTTEEPSTEEPTTEEPAAETPTAEEPIVDLEPSAPASAETAAAAAIQLFQTTVDETLYADPSNFDLYPGETVTFTVSYEVQPEDEGASLVNYVYVYDNDSEDPETPIGGDDSEPVDVEEEANTYTLTYDANGGRGEDEVDTYDEGDTATVRSRSSVGFYRPGYSFEGWNTRADGRGTWYDAGDTIVMNEDVILYAQWDRNSSGGSDNDDDDDDDDNDRPEQEDPAPELDKESHIAYVSGTPEGTIEPNAYITREEVATIFFRLLTDRSRANYITDYNPFPDVDSSRWSFYPIVTMNNAGIMHGYDDGNFAPSGYITRAEFAVVAAQFSDAEYTGADLFSDISGHWAREYINRAASEGWISGYPDGSFGPDDYITRAQVMALVNEVLDRAPDADYMLDDMITWPDNADESAWYYEDVQEATNSHSYVWRNSGRTSEEWEDLIDTRTLDELVRDAFNGVGISY